MRVTFEGVCGTVEGILTVPGNVTALPIVVVCHPHPLMGGNMHNNVVTGVCASLHAHGIGSLRFNFRGVGASYGYHDNGIGEVDDVKSAIAYVKSTQQLDSDKLALSGYSFGAAIALKACVDSHDLLGVSLISLPAIDNEELTNHWPSIPTQLIVGQLDKLDFVNRVIALDQKHAEIVDTQVIGGSDHFFSGEEYIVGDMVARFFISQFNEK